MKRIILTVLTAIALSLPYSNIAQTGPGGVGNSSNNILWLDASSLTLNNNDPISLWADISGNNNDAFQNNTNIQPTLLTNSINGNNVLNFAGKSDILRLTNHIQDSSLTFFSVFNSFNQGQKGILEIGKHYFLGKHTKAYAFYDNTYHEVSKATLGYSIFSAVSNNTPSSYVQIRADKNSYSFNRTNFYYSSTSSVGGRLASVNSRFEGNIPEIIVFNTTLNSAQRKIVNNYLAAKYNLIAEQNLYTYKTTFNKNVIGIGQEADGNNTSAQGRDSLLISNPSSLDNGDYLFTGHNNAGYASSSSVGSGVVERWSQVWRVDKTGTPGTVDLEFFVGANDFSAPGNYIILIENQDGNFANGGVVIHEAGRFYDASKQSVKFTGVDLPDGAYFTLAEKDAPISSIGGGDWNNPAIWSCECIPSMEDLVITNDSIVITSNQSVLDIQINSGGSLTFANTDTLFVHGNFEISGKLYEGVGTIAAVRNDGVNQDFTNNSGQTLNFNNLYVNNSNGLFLINGDWSLTNSLRVTAAGMNVTNANSMTLVSNATKTSEILPSMPNAFSGDFIVQRYISSRNANYANISSPIKNGTIADWDDDLFLSGVNGNDGNAVTSTGQTFYSVFTYYPRFGQDSALKSTTEPLHPGIGYEVYLADNTSTFNGKVIDYLGTPNTGVPSNRILTKKGWNLLGNHHHSHIELDSIDIVSFANADYYIYNSQTGSYNFLTGNNKPLLAPGQGFWIDASVRGILIEIKEEDKVSSNSSAFLRKKNTEPYFNLNISNNQNPFKHKMRLAFDVFATAEMDEKDARHLPSPIKEAPAIYSKAINSDEELIMNSLNPTENSQLVPVSIYAGVEGEYEISADNLDALYDNYSCVYLKDNEREEAIDLMVEPRYSFEAAQGKSDRFHLILSNSYEECQEMIENGSFTQKLDTKVSLRNAYDNWYLDYTLGEAQTQLEIRVYNMSGQEVKAPMSFEAHGAGTYPLQHLNDLEGIYLIQVIGKDVFLNKQVKL